MNPETKELMDVQAPAEQTTEQAVESTPVESTEHAEPEAMAGGEPEMAPPALTGFVPDPAAFTDALPPEPPITDIAGVPVTHDEPVSARRTPRMDPRLDRILSARVGKRMVLHHLLPTTDASLEQIVSTILDAAHDYDEHHAPPE